MLQLICKQCRDVALNKCFWLCATSLLSPVFRLKSLPRQVHVDAGNVGDRFLDIDFRCLAGCVRKPVLDMFSVLPAPCRVRGAERPDVFEHHVVRHLDPLLRPDPHRIEP